MSQIYTSETCMQYETKYLWWAKKLTCSQLHLPHWTMKRKNKKNNPKATWAKDVLRNINRMQAAEITPNSDRMVLFAGAWYYLQQARSIPSLPGVMGVQSAFFVPGDLDPLTLTFKLVRVMDQTRLPCEFGANLFSSSQDIWVVNKKNKVTDSSKNRNLPACGKSRCSSEEAV